MSDTHARIDDRRAAIADLLKLAGLPGTAEHIVIEGRDPILPSPVRLADAAACALAACAGAACAIWSTRTSESQSATVDAQEAAVALESYRRLALITDDRVEPIPPPTRDVLSAPLRTQDGRWIHLNGSQPHFREPTLALLACDADHEAVQRAVSKWCADELESRLSAVGVPAAVYRTGEEWALHPQGRELTETPLIEIEQVGHAPVTPIGPESNLTHGPLGGVRIVDLSRVLAGPSTVKLLSGLGADAIRLTRPGAFEELSVAMDTGFGKRSAWLNVGVPQDRRRLDHLVAGADVLVENSRFGSLARKGVGIKEMVALRQGLIYVSLTCYGHAGAWRGRPGYEPHADAVAGLRMGPDPQTEPHPFFRTIADYTTGWLGALGVMGALQRRASEGGSYHVRVSLARTAMWVKSLGNVDPSRATNVARPETFLMTSETPYGVLQHTRPPIALSRTPMRWIQPTVPLGTHPPVWPVTIHGSR